MLSGIVLAAGESRRMGQQKALLPYAGVTVIEHIVSEMLAGGLGEVLVVAGHAPEGIQERLRKYPVRVILNERHQEGMLSSVRAGLCALPQEATGAAIFLGDHPQVRAELVRVLLKAYEASEKSILIPRCQGRGGHPVFLSLHWREELLSKYDELGLRGLFRAHPASVQYVDVDAPDILEDMDTPADYLRALEQLARAAPVPGQRVQQKEAPATPEV